MLGGGKQAQGMGRADFTGEGNAAGRMTRLSPAERSVFLQGEQYVQRNRAGQSLVCLRNRDPSLLLQHKVGWVRAEGSGTQVFLPFLNLSPASHRLSHH